MEQPGLADGQTAGKPAKKERPMAITVICVISFIGAVFAIPMVFSKVAEQAGNWYPPYLASSAVVGLICMMGLWQMKKWGAYTYLGIVAVNQIVLSMMGVWNTFALLIPAVVIAIAFAYLKRMN